MKKDIYTIGVIILTCVAIIVIFIATDLMFSPSEVIYSDSPYETAISSDENYVDETLDEEVSTTTNPNLEIPGGYNYISYSQIFGIGYSINTKELYTWCGKKDFTSIKGDVQITSDGKLVMCHDEGFTLDKNGKIITYNSANATAIRNLTEEDCLSLRHANTDSSICTFEEYIKICKQYNKIAFITIRNKHMNEVVPTMMETLEKYQMINQSIINSFTYSSLLAVRKADSSIMLSYVQPFKTKVTTDDVDRAVALGNCLVCGFNFSGKSTVNDVASAIDTSVIEYANEKGVPLYEAQVDSMEIAKKLKEYGISGVQMTRAPILN